ncbi:MAG: GC-type dockerin domain-anchored protein [Planctomycetota bacterium]
MKNHALAVALALLASVAAGQVYAQSDEYRLEIRVDRPILEPGESATVELWAYFDRARDGGVYGVGTDLLTDFGSTGWADLELFGLVGPGVVGELGPEGITGIGNGQFCFPCAGCGIADDSSPIGVWRATFTAPPVGFPLFYTLSTRTSVYQMHNVPCDADGVSRLDELVEGLASIRIVPCRADINGDGFLTLTDYLDFLNLFDARDPLVDFDFDGMFTIFDFLEFQNRFDRGC